MANSTYPGNPALAPEIQQRVQGTFRQTLDLAGKGSLKEALLGCDFVLRLDPQFTPASRLADRLASATGPIDVTGFLDAPAAPAEPEWAGDDDLDLPELPALPEFGMEPTELRGQLEALVAGRRFADALRLAESEALAVQGDAELRRLAEAAQAAMEAEPYLRPFLDAARSAALAGRGDEMEGQLRKAEALDATHPEIAAIRRLLRQAAAAPAAVAPPPARQAGPTFAGTPAEDATGFSFAADAFADPSFDAPPREVAVAGDGRIDELLREGQAAFDRGEYQNAIDAWSRIFLIDIDHREAAQRIEEARRLKAEREREAEELFHDASARFDAGDLAGARTGFERVLEIAPTYFAAREFLDRLNSGDVPGPVPAAPTFPEAPSADTEVPPAAGAPARTELKQEVFVPPEPGEERRAAPVGSRVAVTAKRGGAAAGRRLFVLVGGAVLVAVVAGAWFLWSSRETLFPNSTPTPAPVAAADPIARAKALHAEGKTALAIAQLRRLPPDSPVQAEARALVSQWEAAAEPAKQEGPEPEVLAKRETLLAGARVALAEGENVRATLLYDQAAALAALEGEAAAQAAQARERSAALASELAMFRSGEWEYLLNNLWRKREADPRNRDIQRLMVDSYYNLGVRDLQRGDANAAAEKFREASSIDARDREIQRLALFARTYQERSEDLLYRIYVKYLPVR